jgi:hypothetical protein
VNVDCCRETTKQVVLKKLWATEAKCVISGIFPPEVRNEVWVVYVLVWRHEYWYTIAFSQLRESPELLFWQKQVGRGVEYFLQDAE